MQQKILLVVGDPSVPTSTDGLIRGLLEGLSFAVTYRADEDTEDVDGYNGVVITESCNGATLAGKYVTAKIPVISHEFAWGDDAGLWNLQNISNEAVNQLSVQASTHPIMTGPYGSFSGTVTFSNSPTTQVIYVDAGLVTFGAGVTVVAQSVGTANFKYVLACNKGATLISGTAAERRVIMYPSDVDGLQQTGHINGAAMLKNAYNWTFASFRPVFKKPWPLVAAA